MLVCRYCDFFNQKVIPLPQGDLWKEIIIINKKKKEKKNSSGGYDKSAGMRLYVSLFIFAVLVLASVTRFIQ